MSNASEQVKLVAGMRVKALVDICDYNDDTDDFDGDVMANAGTKGKVLDILKPCHDDKPVAVLWDGNNNFAFVAYDEIAVLPSGSEEK